MLDLIKVQSSISATKLCYRRGFEMIIMGRSTNLIALIRLVHVWVRKAWRCAKNIEKFLAQTSNGTGQHSRGRVGFRISGNIRVHFEFGMICVWLNPMQYFCKSYHKSHRKQFLGGHLNWHGISRPKYDLNTKKVSSELKTEARFELSTLSIGGSTGAYAPPPKKSQKISF